MEAGADSEEMMRMKVARKRIAIAADALSNASDVKIPNIPKTEAVLRVLGAVTSIVHPNPIRAFYARSTPILIGSAL